MCTTDITRCPECGYSFEDAFPTICPGCFQQLESYWSEEVITGLSTAQANKIQLKWGGGAFRRIATVFGSIRLSLFKNHQATQARRAEAAKLAPPFGWHIQRVFGRYPMLYHALLWLSQNTLGRICRHRKCTT